MEVHQSRLKSWRLCHAQHDYKYNQKLIKRRPRKPLLRGSTVHRIIEYDINGLDPWVPFEEFKKQYKKLFLEQQEEYGDLPELVKRMMEEYFKWYKKDPIKWISVERGKPKAEYKFVVPLTSSINLGGKIDAVGQSKDKLRWLVDHKNNKTIPTGDIIYSDIQTVLYAWALLQKGIHIDGVMWNYIRAKAPSAPELLKNGDLSRRKNIDTTWGVYKQAIKDNGLKVKDYKDMEEHLQGKENDFFQRVYIPLDKSVMKTIVSDARVTAREIKRKGTRDKVRTFGRHCDWCDFKDLCQAELRSLDAKFIRKTLYMVKKDAKEETKETEE